MLRESEEPVSKHEGVVRASFETRPRVKPGAPQDEDEVLKQARTLLRIALLSPFKAP